MESKRVIIIGGGFGGLYAAKSLARARVNITIVDRRNYHLFQPLLYQVATAGLDPADVAYPVRTIFGRDSHVVFRHGRAASVDLDARHVTLGDGTALDYDRLVVATGATDAITPSSHGAVRPRIMSCLSYGLPSKGKALHNSIRYKELGSFRKF